MLSTRKVNTREVIGSRQSRIFRFEDERNLVSKNGPSAISRAVLRYRVVDHHE